jgi:hypothetical protein
MSKLTKKRIEKELPENCFLNKVGGVYYFIGEYTYNWADSCSNFCTLDHGTLEQWIERFNYLKEYNESY